MSKTNKEKNPMSIKDKIKILPMEVETIPPQKNSTKAQKPKIQMELLQEGDEYISIKAEMTKVIPEKSRV